MRLHAQLQGETLRKIGFGVFCFQGPQNDPSCQIQKWEDQGQSKVFGRPSRLLRLASDAGVVGVVGRNVVGICSS